MTKRREILEKEAVMIIKYVQRELIAQVERGECASFASATITCVDGVCDMIGACANELNELINK